MKTAVVVVTPAFVSCRESHTHTRAHTHKHTGEQQLLHVWPNSQTPRNEISKRCKSPPWQCNVWGPTLPVVAQGNDGLDHLKPSLVTPLGEDEQNR